MIDFFHQSTKVLIQSKYCIKLEANWLMDSQRIITKWAKQLIKPEQSTALATLKFLQQDHLNIARTYSIQQQWWIPWSSHHYHYLCVVCSLQYKIIEYTKSSLNQLTQYTLQAKYSKRDDGKMAKGDLLCSCLWHHNEANTKKLSYRIESKMSQ